MKCMDKHIDLIAWMYEMDREHKGNISLICRLVTVAQRSTYLLKVSKKAYRIKYQFSAFTIKLSFIPFHIPLSCLLTPSLHQNAFFQNILWGGGGRFVLFFGINLYCSSVTARLQLSGKWGD